MKAENDDQKSAYPGNPELVRSQELAEEGGGGPKEEEDAGEPRHKQEGVNQRSPAARPFLEVLQGHAGDEAQVARHQGQNTWGKEGKDPSPERDSEPHRIRQSSSTGFGGACPSS